ncbi:hypothetical protein [Mycobacterium sp. URHB0021]
MTTPTIDTRAGVDNVDGLNIGRPHWLFACGNAERVEVLRSHGLHGDEPEPLQADAYVWEHGLVLLARESFDHPHFMGGGVDGEVYVTPALRNALHGFELLPTIDGFAGTNVSLLAQSALEFVRAHWPFGPEADAFDEDDEEDV